MEELREEIKNMLICACENYHMVGIGGADDVDRYLNEVTDKTLALIPKTLKEDEILEIIDQHLTYVKQENIKGGVLILKSGLAGALSGKIAKEEKSPEQVERIEELSLIHSFEDICGQVIYNQPLKLVLKINELIRR